MKTECNDYLSLVSLVLLPFSAALGGSALQGLRVQPDWHRLWRVQHRLLIFQRVHHRLVSPFFVPPVLFAFTLQNSSSSSQSAGWRLSEAPHLTQIGTSIKFQHRRLVFQRNHHRLVFTSLVPPFLLVFTLQNSSSSSQSAGWRLSEAPHLTQIGTSVKFQHRRLVFQRNHHRLVFTSLVPPFLLVFTLQHSNSSTQSADWCV